MAIIAKEIKVVKFMAKRTIFSIDEAVRAKKPDVCEPIVQNVTKNLSEKFTGAHQNISPGHIQ